jgi:hypothetical protein
MAQLVLKKRDLVFADTQSPRADTISTEKLILTD